MFRCEVGHELRGDDLHSAATARASVALWMAIEALESEATALRLLADSAARSPASLDGEGPTSILEQAEQAERDAKLLRRLAGTHAPPGTLPPGGLRARLDEAVGAVSLFLVAEAPLGETLNRIAVLARDAVSNAAAAGITLLDERRRPRTRVWTHDLSPAIDEGQYQDGAGPCLEAYTEGVIVRVDDTREVVDRWPAFSRRAAEYGVLSTLSLPLRAAGDTFGALNLYATAELAFSAIDETDAEMFATQVSVVLANARAYWDAFDLAQGLRQALESRAVIEQAKGKIMGSTGCDADAAFTILVRASQRENVKLRDLARRIVEGPDPGAGLT